MGDRRHPRLAGADQAQSAAGVEAAADEQPFVRPRQPQEGQTVARRVVDGTTPEAREQADNEGLGFGVTGARRRSDEAEGLVEPGFDDINAEAWTDRQPPPVDGKRADVAAGPPAAVAPALDQGQPIVVFGTVGFDAD